MKTIAFCLLFVLFDSRPAFAQVPLDTPTLEIISGCLFQCQFFSKLQPYSPLPSNLRHCLEDAVVKLRGQQDRFVFEMYLGSLFMYANELSNTGALRQAKEQFLAIETALQQMKTSDADSLMNLNMAHTHNMIALCYAQMFDLDNALIYIEKAIKGYARLNMNEALFNAYVNKAGILNTQGNSRSGLMMSEQALRLWHDAIEATVLADQRLNKLSAENQKSICQYDLADSLAAEKGTRAILPEYQKMLTGLRKTLSEVALYETLNEDAKVATATLCLRIQSCFARLRPIESAWADSILKYQAFLEAKGVDSTTAKLYFGMTQALAALAYAGKGQWEEAYNLSVRACQHHGYLIANIFDRKTRLPPATIEQKQNLIVVFRLQATMLRMRKTDQRALEQALFVYDRIFELVQELRLGFLSENNLERATERFIPIYHEAALTAVDLHKQYPQGNDYFERAFQYAEQGKSFTLRNALRHRVNNPTLSTIEREKRDNLREAELMYQKDPKQLSALENAYQELQTWREKVKKDAPSYFAEQISEDTMRLDFVRRELVNNDTTALIEFSGGDDSTILLVVTKSKVYWNVVPHLPNWSKTLDAYCGSIFSETEDFIAAGQKIYQVLLANPIERQLPKAINRLILVPDGRLREVVFESLLTKPFKVSADYGQLPYLLRHYDLSYQYSLATYKYSADIQRKASEYPLGIFIGKYSPNDTDPQRCSNDKLTILEAAAHEIADSSGGREPFESATESKFRQEAHRFDELLFVMHGCIDSADLLESSILFTKKEDTDDGRLTVREVLGLPQDLNARLAVFVSCNTARGLRVGGEGIISLARAFAYAGVPATVAATAPVSDNEMSAGLLKSFHQNLKAGMPKDRALGAAKRKLINSYHPYYWANFILLGDPAPMTSR